MAGIVVDMGVAVGIGVGAGGVWIGVFVTELVFPLARLLLDPPPDDCLLIK